MSQGVVYDMFISMILSLKEWNLNYCKHHFPVYLLIKNWFESLRTLLGSLDRWQMYTYWTSYFSQQRSVPVCVLGLPFSSPPVKHNPVCKIRSANHCLPRKDATLTGKVLRKGLEFYSTLTLETHWGSQFSFHIGALSISVTFSFSLNDPPPNLTPKKIKKWVVNSGLTLGCKWLFISRNSHNVCLFTFQFCTGRVWKSMAKVEVTTAFVTLNDVISIIECWS